MSEKLIQEPAVVLGCGMGGLAAAAALSNHFENVVIIERDEIPDQPRTRRGVPQDEQLHNVLSCAQRNLEQLIPGFLEGLNEYGVGNARVADQTHVHELGIRMPERDLGLQLMSAWRPVIEHVARQRLLQTAEQVTIRGLSRATGLRISPKRGLEGVIVDTEQGEITVPASVLVDSTGSASPAHRWLENQGQQAPPLEVTKVNQWYVSTIFQRPLEYVENNDFWLSFPCPPHSRGGLVSPIGDDLWCVSLSGRSQDSPPSTVEEVKAYAHTLEDEQAVATLIQNAEAQTKPNRFLKPVTTIRRYDRVEQPVPGILPLGDSIASLNPLFGQGMSVAAWQAVELDRLLGAYRHGAVDLRDLTSHYMKDALSAAQTAWELGEVVDQILAGSPDATLKQVRKRYQALGQLIETDPQLHKLYVSVWHLIEPAAVLQTPELLSRLAETAQAVI